MQFRLEELTHAEAKQAVATLSPPEVARREGDGGIATSYRLLQITGFLLKYRADMDPVDGDGVPTSQMDAYCKWLTTTTTPD